MRALWRGGLLMDSDIFFGLLELGVKRFPKLRASLGANEEGALRKIVAYREAILEENGRQNLTRLLTPAEFYWGHIEDVFQLLEEVELEYPVLDIGTGGGVPGIPAAILTGQPWILLDSELRKTEFLTRTCQDLNIQNTQVVHDRVEKVITQLMPRTLVSRAVGKIEKLYGWTHHCSTWNSMILFKGPNFEAEWSDFLLSRYRSKLAIQASHEYPVSSQQGEEERVRRILRVVPVRRNT